MIPRWQYLDPPAPADAGGRYDRDQVLEVERWAWAGRISGRRAEYFYDGFDFWLRQRSGERRILRWRDAPAHGWWHKPACNCPLCVARHSPAHERQTAGRASS